MFFLIRIEISGSLSIFTSSGQKVGGIDFSWYFPPLLNDSYNILQIFIGIWKLENICIYAVSLCRDFSSNNALFKDRAMSLLTQILTHGGCTLCRVNITCCGWWLFKYYSFGYVPEPVAVISFTYSPSSSYLLLGSRVLISFPSFWPDAHPGKDFFTR